MDCDEVWESGSTPVGFSKTKEGPGDPSAIHVEDASPPDVEQGLVSEIRASKARGVADSLLLVETLGGAWRGGG